MFLKTITENKILSSLNLIDLIDAMNFSSDMSVSYLALLLAKAKNLESIFILDHEGRRIAVKISEPIQHGDIEEGYGDIIIFDQMPPGN